VINTWWILLVAIKGGAGEHGCAAVVADIIRGMLVFVGLFLSLNAKAARYEHQMGEHKEPET